MDASTRTGAAAPGDSCIAHPWVRASASTGLLRLGLAALLLSLGCGVVHAQPGLSPPSQNESPAQLQFATALARKPAPEEVAPLLRLGTGDAVEVRVFGRPEFDTTTYIADNGTISVPLAGPVQVAGMGPSQAADAIAQALKEGQYLVDPQVSIKLVEFRSQQVSVLGEVRQPGRFPVESRMTVLDLIAQAGGINESGSNTVYLLRPGSDGHMLRLAIDLEGLVDGDIEVPALQIRGGDSLVVPKAPQYYVYGEVQSPNMYRLEPGTTVVEAISRSGGLTEKGSDNRIEIKRRNADGDYKTFDADLTDLVQSGDVIRIKERIF